MALHLTPKRGEATTEQALAAALSARPLSAKAGFVHVEGRPNRASVGDAEWERRAEKLEPEALPTLRAGAEKWTAAIASLTGVFGLIVLVKGPEDIAKVEGTLDLLPGSSKIVGILVALGAFLATGMILVLRRKGLSALGWGSGLVAELLLLIFFIFVSLFESDGTLPIAWETVVMVSLALAITLASIAIVRGARAAYGMPSPLTRPSGQLFRWRQRSEFMHSRSALGDAIRAAIATVVFIAAAIGITWVKTPDAPSPTNLLIVRADDTSICGTLEGRTKRLLDVREKDAPAATRIEVAKVRSTAVVDSCPGG